MCTLPLQHLLLSKCKIEVSDDVVHISCSFIFSTTDLSIAETVI